MLYSYNDVKDRLCNFKATERTRKKSKRVFEGKFIDLRIDPSTIPEGKYMYHCRHADSGDWCTPVTIETRVIVNFCGTLITDKEIEFPDPNDKYIPIKNAEY